MRLFLKVLLGSICVVMIAVAVYTSLQSDLFSEFGRLIREPWMAATLADFYFNILIFSLWVIYKENRMWPSVIWVLAFVCLGSIATAFYVLLQLVRLKPGEPVSSLLLRR